MEKKPTALILDPFFGEIGGAKIVTLWMLETLKNEYDLTLFCWKGVDLAGFNRFAGTSLVESDFRVLTPHWAIRFIGEVLRCFDRDDFSIQRWALMLRWLKSFSSNYDVVISSRDETDFGRPGIQYIHYPYLAPHSEVQQRAEGLVPTVKASSRYRPWRVISGFRFENLAINKTLTNSNWTASVIRESHGLAAEVLYPPIPGDFPRRTWEERDDMVICVGRLSRDKRVSEIIEIVRRVRERHPEMGLAIVGVPSPDPGGPEEFERIQALARRYSWVELHPDVSREQLIEFVSRCKIGLHAKHEEHFGIAVAEMLRGGCVVLCHNSGGQVEILGSDQRVLFSSTQEAVDRIEHILSDDTHRQDLLTSQTELALQFSTGRFQSRFRRVVAEFIASSTP